MSNLMPVERIESKIFLIRGQKVMLDRDLAGLYEVPTKVLNQAVKRNMGRFPEDFMFSLSRQEILRMSQFVTSSWGPNLKFSKNVNAFTEQGVAMLSSVLNSERAVQINIFIMRAFVHLKQVLSTHKELAYKLNTLEERIGKCEEGFREILSAMQKLAEPPEREAKKIGFLKD